MKITLELDGDFKTFSSIASLQQYVDSRSEQLSEIGLITAVNNDDYVKEFLKSNGHKLPLGVVAVSSYKGMTECFNDYYMEERGWDEEYYNEVSNDVKKYSNKLFNTLDMQPGGYPTRYFHYAKFSEDLKSIELVTDSEDNY